METQHQERLRKLIQHKAYRTGDFVLASGRRSSYYLDLRTVTLDAVGLALISDALLERVGRIEGVTHVGGMAVGAVPLVAGLTMASAQTSRPLQGFFVRKEAKGHGATTPRAAAARLGGNDPTGGIVVLLEDTTTSGGSTIEAVDLVRALPATVAAVISVVDRQEGAAESFAAANVPFECLFRAADLAH